MGALCPNVVTIVFLLLMWVLPCACTLFVFICVQVLLSMRGRNVSYV